ncbi:kanadaptin isoform X2 [Bombyx mori]|uniref:FHA domain-containing protein n=1 Tax=Bombyx mori TaxID=7091 RepID=A0A8R2C641_BOMMO|nr:kanadaptin isoform X2 [Bombyx mori]
MAENKTPSPQNEEKIEFKKPVLFGRVGKLPKKVKNESEKVIEEPKDETPAESITESTSKESIPPPAHKKEGLIPIPYKEPKWSGLCPDGSDYALEVIKSGIITDKVDLTGKPYHVFGRFTNCDIIMAHPTVSRHHAVLQYKAFAEEGEPVCGWYLYDLGSTHGTFLNKERLKANHYTRVRVGHQIKFGSSTRNYIVMGPDFDCEGESELSVTEIKQKALEMKAERDRMIKEAIEQREKERLEEEKRKEELGIDWGMGEDADEEPDLVENPYAATANEELYLDDPKKTLRGYFEREGHELNYDCEERGIGQYICRVELPMDDPHGRPVMAEVIHRGKKKEAVVACALEACRILDRAGLLRQAKHESRRRKQRDWSADDYYDSDEDTFLDRTGHVETKRRIRMERLGAAELKNEKPLTYDDLLSKVEELERKLAAEEKSLARLRAELKAGLQPSGDADALDHYMSTLKHGTMAQKAEISQTKVMNIQKLRKDLSKTQRLAELARPAHLPPLVAKQETKMAVKVGSNSVVYGKRIRLKEDTRIRPKVSVPSKQDDGEFVEEVESDEEEKNESTDHNKKNNTENSTKFESASKAGIIEAESSVEGARVNDKDDDGDVSKREGDERPRTFGPMRPPDGYVIPDDYYSTRDCNEIMEE